MTYTAAEAARLGYQKHLERQRIIDKYGADELEKRKNLYCRICRLARFYPMSPPGSCKHDLLPLTLDGATCIYFERLAPLK